MKSTPELNPTARRASSESMVLDAASGGCIMGASFAAIVLAPSMFRCTGALGIVIGIVMMGIAWVQSRKQSANSKGTN